MSSPRKIPSILKKASSYYRRDLQRRRREPGVWRGLHASACCCLLCQLAESVLWCSLQAGTWGRLLPFRTSDRCSTADLKGDSRARLGNRLRQQTAARWPSKWKQKKRGFGGIFNLILLFFGMCAPKEKCGRDAAGGCDPRAGEDNEGDKMQEWSRCTCGQLFALTAVTRKAELSSSSKMERAEKSSNGGSSYMVRQRWSVNETDNLKLAQTCWTRGRFGSGVAMKCQIPREDREKHRCLWKKSWQRGLTWCRTRKKTQRLGITKRKRTAGSLGRKTNLREVCGIKVMGREYTG